jgi:hypothetical protein
VFDRHVRQEIDVRVDALAEPHRLVGPPFDDALVGEARPDVGVDADEGGARGRRHRERGHGVVPEDVDPDRDVDRLPDGPGRGGHLRDDVRGHLIGIERRVAEVLHQDGVDATGVQRTSVGERALPDPRPVAAEARRTRKRFEVDHPDDAVRELHGDGWGSRDKKPQSAASTTS